MESDYIISKIHSFFSILRYFPQTLFFNFHYFPFKEAIKLPVLLYRPHFISTKGSVRLVLNNNRLHFGMIRLGFRMCGLYPNSGITWENKGGEVIFEGNSTIGNDCYLSFGESSKVIFGDGFCCNAGLKMVSNNGISFGKSTELGWGCLLMDTNFHPTFDIAKKSFKRHEGHISIGEYNWFGSDCKIMHSVTTPERCIFGMGSILTRGCVAKSYCVMGGAPVRILSENVMRIFEKGGE